MWKRHVTARVRAASGLGRSVGLGRRGGGRQAGWASAGERSPGTRERPGRCGWRTRSFALDSEAWTPAQAACPTLLLRTPAGRTPASPACAGRCPQGPPSRQVPIQASSRPAGAKHQGGDPAARLGPGAPRFGAGRRWPRQGRPGGGGACGADRGGGGAACAAAPTDSREAGRTREVWGVRRGRASWRGRRGAEP